jgi:hypothetical protein
MDDAEVGCTNEGEMMEDKVLARKMMLIASDFLELASDEFSKHGCNDWEFPANWTKKEKQKFVKMMHKRNNSLDEYDPEELDVPDWWVMSFLASLLKEQVQ